MPGSASRPGIGRVGSPEVSYPPDFCQHHVEEPGARAQGRCRGDGHRPGITPQSGRGGTSSNLVEQESQSTPSPNPAPWCRSLGGNML